MRIVLLVSLFLVVKLIAACEYRIFSSSLETSTASSVVTASFDYQYKNGLTISIKRGENVIQTIMTADNLGSSADPVETGKSVQFSGLGRAVAISLEVDDSDYTEFKVTREMQKGEYARDCLMFESGVHWYGGPQMKTSQYWPIESQNFTNEAYVTKEKESMAVTERYWLNSKGVYIYVKPEAPLFISQVPNQVLCLTAKKESPYNTDSRFFVFEYVIGVAKDPKEAHLKAVKNHLGLPTGIPDQTMVQYPIWSTWAKYLRDINEDVVKEFAKTIKEKGFDNSQLEIDDLWEVCYGSLRIDKNKFNNMASLVNTLKTDATYGVKRVTLWIHPFINVGCEPEYSYAKKMGYFVQNSTGGILTKWWNTPKSDDWASYIDFTKPAAANWFIERLTALKEEGTFDSFKFDAGETSWAPANPILQGDKSLHPGKLTTDYINTLLTRPPLNNIVEVRSVQGNQKMDIFVRMIDKDSFWDYRNGLPTLVTTLLQMNMNGYPFVLPDMIGGNGYPGSEVTKTLFIRWMQANIFMPAMQYSFPPWDYDPSDGSDTETNTLAVAANALHYQYAEDIKTAMEKAVSDGYPVNPPIWWIDPTDQMALACGDQFLLGEKILVAPVLEKDATTRNIYLPKGTWQDGNTPAKSYTGPRNLTAYAAPLNVLPYFIKTD
ncbi:myogenesis-regulating glycosidase [Culicoides brevitarsis]|uniref:myogenesis-regulating glycosidase n=1 Tax=Culicoides brevitarsis TaxID=469753 RepID=UPI00307B847C